MSLPLLTSELLEQMSRLEVEALPRSALDRFDYDPPKERAALVVFSPALSAWSIVAADAVSRVEALHRQGCLLFGRPPWRSAAVLRVFGRLGSVEAAVSALARPGADFEYSFAVEDGEDPVFRRSAADASGRSALPAPALAARVARPRAEVRARWRKPQGELF